MHVIKAVCQTTANVNELTRRNDLHSWFLRKYVWCAFLYACWSLCKYTLQALTQLHRIRRVPVAPFTFPTMIIRLWVIKKQFTYILNIFSQMLMHSRNIKMFDSKQYHILTKIWLNGSVLTHQLVKLGNQYSRAKIMGMNQERHKLSAVTVNGRLDRNTNFASYII